MDGFDGLKEYPYTDKLLSYKDKICDLWGKGKDYVATHKEIVDIVLKTTIVIVGTLIAIKDTVTNVRISKEKSENGHARVNIFCFFVDLLNIIKRVLAI